MLDDRAQHAAQTSARGKTPPAARVEPVEDCYFGEVLRDPYRWMENDADPDWPAFLHSQNLYTRSVLDGLAQRPALLRRIQEISREVATTAQVQRCGEAVFYLQQPKGAANFMLFLRRHGQDVLLVDPTTKGATIAIDWWRASPDGRYLVYGISADGSEDSVLHILDVEHVKDLPVSIPDTHCAEPSWLDDSSGFFYTQLTGQPDTAQRFLDSRARFIVWEPTRLRTRW